MQFVTNELILLVLCLLTLGYGGMDGVLSTLSMYVGMALSMFLTYQYAKLRSTVYIITREQLKKSEGVFVREEDYVELYRVVDFAERRNLLQQLFGLKTVTIFSGDRTTPKLCLQGIRSDLDLVSIIRERVEYSKTQKAVYEITNRY